MQLGKGKAESSRILQQTMPVTCSSRPISTVGTLRTAPLECLCGLEACTNHQQPFLPLTGKTPRVPGRIRIVSRRSSLSNGGWMLLLHVLHKSRPALHRAGFAYPNRPFGPAWVAFGQPVRSQGSMFSSNTASNYETVSPVL